MTDQTPPPPPSPDPAAAPPPPPPAPEQYAPPPAPQYAAPPANPYGNAPMMQGPGPLGKVRSTGTCFLLMVVTLGIYSVFYWYYTHDEMKKHTGRGLGGVVALILALFVSFVMPFFTSSEVGNMQEAAGRQKTVEGITGLWILLPLAGAIVWFVKTNRALNDYWTSMGAPA